MLRVYKGRFLPGVHYSGLVRTHGLRCPGIPGVHAVGAGHIWITRLKMATTPPVIRDNTSTTTDRVVH